MTSNAPRPQDKYQRAALVGIIVLALYYLLTAVGCVAPLPVIQYRDSVRVEVRERVVRDTAYFTIVGDHKAVIADTCSHLENTYAESEAAIRGGMLHHSLTTKPQEVLIPFWSEVRDTFVLRERAEVQRVEVERQPTKWESFCEVCGYILLALVALVIVWLVLRITLRR